MTGFRGSDETLDAEIDALERIARIRLRRATRELAELDKDLRGLRAEKAARRRARAGVLVPSTGSTSSASA
ncbi:MAG: hypothetical protein L3K08_04015 [Thermoplasmata archaeon]|nr:hypothetical protein [Thermoplasmata archaeon]